MRTVKLNHVNLVSNRLNDHFHTFSHKQAESTWQYICHASRGVTVRNFWLCACHVIIFVGRKLHQHPVVLMCKMLS